MRRRAFVLVLSGAGTLARGLRAQPKAMRVAGFLGTNLPGPASSNVASLRQGLKEAGYVDGQNLAMEFRWAEGRYDRLSALAADLVGRKVDILVVSGTPGIRAAKGATSTIPIVFFGGGDLVADGLIVSLARPGANVTGIGIFANELNPKRLELLSELIPPSEVIAFLFNPNQSVSDNASRDMQEAARAIDRQLRILKVSTDSEVDSAFATIAQIQAGGLVVAADPFFNSRREQLVLLAARHGVPAIYEWREFAEIGGLISYGPNLSGTWRQVGVYVGRILAGANPADMPIQRPTRFELIVNLKTAKTLGLTIPPSILARTDEVIE
jgi:putative ABC transport system substrate-binding protein